MSAERDLLNKALAVLLELKDCSDSWCEYYVPIGIHYRIDEAIQELLAQPEQIEQDPVAWCQMVEGKVQDLLTSFEMKDWLYDKSWIPLYTAPPKREPLSTDTMLRLITEHRDFPLNLARAVERECGIGDWNE